MRQVFVAVSMVLFSALGVVAGAAEEAPIPREGTSATLTMGSATARALPVGKERVQLTWEFLGAVSATEGKSLTHGASVRCLGSVRALNLEFESYTNACVFTRPDGDQLHWVETLISGRLAGESRGTGTIVGGTGKLAGITGSGEWIRQVVRPALEGTFQTVTRSTMSYRLP